jgi:Ca2+-binding EF-hand superfamily protein
MLIARNLLIYLIGFLTFSEFQQLMIKIDLGISVQEMRFIISEADSNETGVVDYHEFVPLAVDLVQVSLYRPSS